MTTTRDSTTLKRQYRDEGFAVIPGFCTHAEVSTLRTRIEEIIEGWTTATNGISRLDAFRASSQPFTTKEQTRKSDEYFLASGDLIVPFFEERAGREVPSRLAINKIAHALHELDPSFRSFARSPRVGRVLREVMGFASPRPCQSMYIFKQARVGGEVGPHRDGSFLLTEPSTVAGVWLAIDDSTLENGCLWVVPGSHLLPREGERRERAIDRAFKLDDESARSTLFEERTRGDDNSEENAIDMKDSTSFSRLGARPVPVKAGDLIVFHGALLHFSSENNSERTRHALSLHYVENEAIWNPRNWMRSRLDIVPLYRSMGRRWPLPVIDLSSFSHFLRFPENANNEWERSVAAAKFDNAMTACGFAVVVGTGISASLVARVRKLATEFFALENERKRQFRAARYGTSGYNGKGAERVGGSLGDAKFPGTNGDDDDRSKGDPVESLYFVGKAKEISTIIGKRLADASSSSRLFEELKDALITYHREMESITSLINLVADSALFGCSSRATGKEKREGFESIFRADGEEGGRSLKISWYDTGSIPSSKREAVVYGAHTDYEAWTLLSPDANDDERGNGIQIYLREESRWSETIPYLFPDALVINAGDFVERWTEGKWKSALHRVVCSPSNLIIKDDDERGRRGGRLTIPYFVGCDAERVIRPFHRDPFASTSEEQREYPPVKAGEYLKRKIAMGSESRL